MAEKMKLHVLRLLITLEIYLKKANWIKILLSKFSTEVKIRRPAPMYYTSYEKSGEQP